MISKLITVPALGLALVGGLITYAGASAATEPVAGHVEGQVEMRHKKHLKRDMSPEKREALRNALKNCDYAAWKEVVGDTPITQKINEQNFPRFCEAHKLLHSGNVDDAVKIFKELDLKMPKMHKRHGVHKQRHMEQPSQSRP
jgi:hypothetical protein